MDFIERIFGISPDGGDGTTEALYLIVIVALGVAWLTRNRIRSFFKPRDKR